MKFEKLTNSVKNFFLKSSGDVSLEDEEIKEEENVSPLKTGNKKIDKNTSIGDLMEADPEMDDILYEYGLYCGNCFAAGFDTLEEGAKMHGLEDDEIKELIQELNKKAEGKL